MATECKREERRRRRRGGRRKKEPTDLDSKKDEKRQPEGDEDDGDGDNSPHHAHLGSRHLTFNLVCVLEDEEDDVNVVLGEEHQRQ